MDVRSYLPSSHFATIVGSIGLAGGLILLAQYVTNPHAPSAVLTSGDTPSTQHWQAAFNAVQADAPGLPSAPDESVIQDLREAAKSSNMTTSVARSLFVNLSDAGAQGLGGDIPTQEKLIADAATQLRAEAKVTFTASDLILIAETPTSLKEWGNEVMRMFKKYPRANNDEALLALGKAIDYADGSSLSSLGEISSAYAALAKSLSGVAVPSTIAPLYLQLINDLSLMSTGASEMQEFIKDPLRGLVGLQTFQSAGNEATRVLTTLAGQLSNSGILFIKDEPGATWSAFVSSDLP
jgi:hypothetical protein